MLDKILSFLPFLAPIVNAISSAIARKPIPDPAAPSPPTVDAGDAAALAAAQARAASAEPGGKGASK